MGLVHYLCVDCSSFAHMHDCMIASRKKNFFFTKQIKMSRRTRSGFSSSRDYADNICTSSYETVFTLKECKGTYYTNTKTSESKSSRDDVNRNDTKYSAQIGSSYNDGCNSCSTKIINIS